MHSSPCYQPPTWEGNLVTIWSGGSAYHVHVWTYESGTIREALDVGTRFMPEFADSRGAGNLDVVITTSSKKDPVREHHLIRGQRRVYVWLEDGRGYTASLDAGASRSDGLRALPVRTSSSMPLHFTVAVFFGMTRIRMTALVLLGRRSSALGPGPQVPTHSDAYGHPGCFRRQHCGVRVREPIALRCVRRIKLTAAHPVGAEAKLHACRTCGTSVYVRRFSSVRGWGHCATYDGKRTVRPRSGGAVAFARHIRSSAGGVSRNSEGSTAD
jgi:hypothetical protein